MGQKAIRSKKETDPNLIKAKAFAKALKEGGKNYAYITKALNGNGSKTSTGKKYLLTSTRKSLNI